MEAIRQQIGAEQLILIGHSWGSTLAASYMAAYPTHVAKVIFHSPGALWVREVQREFHRTAWTGAEEAPPLRILVALNLLGINPAAAESLISQDELGRWFDKQAATMSTQMVCAGDSQQLPPDMSGSGGNFYANLAIRGSIDGASDAPRPRLASNTTPALIVHGACDYIPWDVAYEYKQTLPQASLVPIDRAGHMINLTHSELLYTVMRSFLLNEPLPIPAYTQPEPPVGH